MPLSKLALAARGLLADIGERPSQHNAICPIAAE
jgi:hypothetical protein